MAFAPPDDCRFSYSADKTIEEGEPGGYRKNIRRGSGNL